MYVYFLGFGFFGFDLIWVSLELGCCGVLLSFACICFGLFDFFTLGLGLGFCVFLFVLAGFCLCFCGTVWVGCVSLLCFCLFWVYLVRGRMPVFWFLGLFVFLCVIVELLFEVVFSGF